MSSDMIYMLDGQHSEDPIFFAVSEADLGLAIDAPEDFDPGIAITTRLLKELPHLDKHRIAYELYPEPYEFEGDDQYLQLTCDGETIACLERVE